MKKVQGLLLIAAAIPLLSGCNVIRMTGSPNQNVGRQLLDLHEAHEKGLMSPEEYEYLKNKIMEEAIEEQEKESEHPEAELH